MRVRMFLVFAFVLAAVTAFGPTTRHSAASDKSPAIRIAPPAPVFRVAERQQELARRRANVANAMVDNSLMVLFSADPKIYAGDVDFYYRQENNLYYLTNLKQTNATLVISKSGGRVNESLFLPKRDRQSEAWNGKMYGNDEAARISGLTSIIDAAELETFLGAVAAKQGFMSAGGASISGNVQAVYLLSPFEPGGEYPKEGVFAARLNGAKVIDSEPIFAELRLKKSPMEIKLVQHAVDITAEALMRSMGTVGKARWEYEVRAEVEYTFRRRNADYWGYPSIVGCGPNATTLHYEESQGSVEKGSIILMDVGAEYDHYTADVTRSFPVNGKFSDAQAEIYQIVFEAQEAAARTIKPGASFRDPSRAAASVIEKGLARIGLITAPDAVIPGTQMRQSRLWYMHDWGHWLGMNVHDVGSYSAEFREGMIMTNEPGIYVREDALDYLPDNAAAKRFAAAIRPAFENYKNIGVRIEDDMLVTKTGVKWMTKQIPRSIADIEAFMAQASKEMAGN